ncbi:MAG TPA: hypothetical protein PKL14_10185 [Holophaga sp.]|jgi:hypothetical protein|nr:hypothetical protein [Holophaga sp.]
MNISRGLLGLAFAMSLVARTPAQDAKAPAERMGPVAFQNFAGGTYFHLSARVTTAQLSAQTPLMTQRLLQVLKDAGIQTLGPLLIIQRGASQDQAQPFDQEVGVLVPKGTAPFGDAKVRELSVFPCATAITSGDFAGAAGQSVFMELFKAAGAKGRIPSGEFREMLLFWEGPASANNLMQIQIGLQ